MLKQIKNSRGSVLIVVLWALIMIGYLVGDYLIHNRSKTGTAMNMTESFKRLNAVESVLNLTTTDKWKTSIDQYKPGKWVDINVEGIDLYFKLENEGTRININTANDAKIRQAVVDIIGDSDIERTNRIADAILDWRDVDDLVRTQGAEKNYYETQGVNYTPADGLFKTLTELLLVRGVGSEIFWGSPGKYAVSNDIQRKCFMEKFTVFNSSIERLSILIPLKKDLRLFYVLFIKGKKSLNVVEQYTQLLEDQIDL